MKDSSHFSSKSKSGRYSQPISPLVHNQILFHSLSEKNYIPFLIINNQVLLFSPYYILIFFDLCKIIVHEPWPIIRSFIIFIANRQVTIQITVKHYLLFRAWAACVCRFLLSCHMASWYTRRIHTSSLRAAQSTLRFGRHKAIVLRTMCALPEAFSFTGCIFLWKKKNTDRDTHFESLSVSFYFCKQWATI